jgi:hypothetical protein
MKTTEAINHFKTATCLAKRLGTTKQAISNWGIYPPDGRQFQLQVLTNGKLKIEKHLLLEKKDS